MSQAANFAAVAVALYAAHHVGDYWVQTDYQARHKGEAGAVGINACLGHVFSYLAVQYGLVLVVCGALDMPVRYLLTAVPALLISGVTHYLADRREHGLMFKLARRIPGKAGFMELGKPRAGRTRAWSDNPQLATGAWALDQSWHIFWGVFVAALVMVTL